MSVVEVENKLDPDCEAKHVKVQIPNADWQCPKCGVGLGQKKDGLVIEDSAGSSDCEALHEDDFLKCYSCGHESSGKKFSKWYANKKNLAPCPCCDGKGVVDKDKVTITVDGLTATIEIRR